MNEKEIMKLITFGVCSYSIIAFFSLLIYGSPNLPLLIFYIIPTIGATMLYVAFKEAFKKKDQK